MPGQYFLPLHAYFHTYILACMRTCINTYMQTCILACIHTCMHTYIRAYMHTCILTACIIAYLHSCMVAWLHTCIPCKLVHLHAGSSYSETFWSHIDRERERDVLSLLMSTLKTIAAALLNLNGLMGSSWILLTSALISVLYFIL